MTRCCGAFQPAHMSGTTARLERDRRSVRLLRAAGFRPSPPDRPPTEDTAPPFPTARQFPDNRSKKPRLRTPKCASRIAYVQAGRLRDSFQRFSYRATGFRCCLSPLQNHIALSVKYGDQPAAASRGTAGSGSGRPHRNQVERRAHCNRGRPPRRGNRGALSAARPLVPGPSGSMMATGRMRPAAIALIFLLDPPESGQRRDMSAALSGRGRPMPPHFTRRRLRMRPDKQTVDQ